MVGLNQATNDAKKGWMENMANNINTSGLADFDLRKVAGDSFLDVSSYQMTATRGCCNCNFMLKPQWNFGWHVGGTFCRRGGLTGAGKRWARILGETR